MTLFQKDLRQFQDIIVEARGRWVGVFLQQWLTDIWEPAGRCTVNFFATQFALKKGQTIHYSPAQILVKSIFPAPSVPSC